MLLCRVRILLLSVLLPCLAIRTLAMHRTLMLSEVLKPEVHASPLSPDGKLTQSRFIEESGLNNWVDSSDPSNG